MSDTVVLPAQARAGVRRRMRLVTEHLLLQRRWLRAGLAIWETTWLMSYLDAELAICSVSRVSKSCGAALEMVALRLGMS